MKRANSVEQKSKREQMILQAALSQFAQKGFHQTRMDDIAASAGISKGTVYLYFGDKSSLFRALLRQNVGTQMEEIIAILAANPPSASTFALLADKMTHVLTQTPLPKLFYVLISEAAQFPEMIAFYRQHFIEVLLPQLAAHLGGNLLAAKLLIAPLTFSLLWQEIFYAHQKIDQVAVHQLIHCQYQLLAAWCAPNQE